MTAYAIAPNGYLQMYLEKKNKKKCQVHQNSRFLSALKAKIFIFKKVMTQLFFSIIIEFFFSLLGHILLNQIICN